MDYELALKLKEAGLKQPSESFQRGYFYYWHNVEAAPVDVQYAFPSRVITSTIWVPTLSELIDACGSDFKSLSRDSDSKGVFWIARSRKEGNYQREVAKTQEIAVANLWLVLNKK